MNNYMYKSGVYLRSEHSVLGCYCVLRRILLNFFGLRDIIMVFTAASETGIIFICTVLSSVSPCLLFEFVAICV